jgi:hypothetical protein
MKSAAVADYLFKSRPRSKPDLLEKFLLDRKQNRKQHSDATVPAILNTEHRLTVIPSFSYVSLEERPECLELGWCCRETG